VTKFFTSDIHLRHKNILKFDKRPYSCIEEHDADIRKRWNETVNEDDEVYIIGDIAFSGADYALDFYNSLNGKLYLIRGNHDVRRNDKNQVVDNRVLSDERIINRFEWIKDYHEMYVGNQMICLFHYPIHEWNKCHRGSWMLFGHTHGNDNHDESFKILNMGINLWRYKPVSYSEIEKIMKNRKDKEHH